MKRTKEEAEQTKESILKAATHLFYEKGFYNTSLNEIAQAINATRGAVYWHFKNKLEIFDALHESLHRPFIEQVTDDLETEHPQPIKQLKELTTKILFDLEDNEDKRKSLALFLFRCDYTGDLAIFKERHSIKKAEKQVLFQKYFQRAITKGILPDTLKPEIYALSYTCFLKGIVYEYIDNTESFRMKRDCPALIDLYFNNFNV